jgi:hypothetical protein
LKASPPRFSCSEIRHNNEPERNALSRDLPELPARQTEQFLPAIEGRLAVPDDVLVLDAQPASRVPVLEVDDVRAFKVAEGQQI